MTLWLAGLLLGTPPTALPVDRAKPAVVLVHGIYDSGRNMEWLAGHFAARGYETFCPSLVPSNGGKSLAELSAQLDDHLRTRFPADRKLHVIAFSMGGLISRHWLQHHAAAGRVVSFATLGTPHRGSLWAWLIPLPGTRDMRAGSPFLRALDAGDESLRSLAPLSIYTPLDLMIVPANSSCWASARMETVWLPAHPLLIYHQGIARRLLLHCADRETGGHAGDITIPATPSPRRRPGAGRPH